MKKKLREVSRHFEWPPRRQSELETFQVISPEGDSKAGFGGAVTAPLSCETQRKTFSEITTSFKHSQFTYDYEALDHEALLVLPSPPESQLEPGSFQPQAYGYRFFGAGCNEHATLERPL
ncbi:hypothetical protein E2C01_041796 [Portunus trituberculatus]|uniref:Uncharacterized protein n=1 Tax=Portunus trituberculatus TaxID=210409 RepID=A0A5B7FKT4_PORTR|nr:hypothetical protein [Portunus trituberculatus]